MQTGGASDLKNLLFPVKNAMSDGEKLDLLSCRLTDLRRPFSSTCIDFTFTSMPGALNDKPCTEAPL